MNDVIRQIIVWQIGEGRPIRFISVRSRGILDINQPGIQLLVVMDGEDLESGARAWLLIPLLLLLLVLLLRISRRVRPRDVEGLLEAASVVDSGEDGHLIPGESDGVPV